MLEAAKQTIKDRDDSNNPTEQKVFQLINNQLI
jgi:hypothetical protein